MSDLAGALQAALEAEVASRTLPGACADLSIDGELAWSGAAGLRDLETREPLEPGARFPIYSITKTFTAASVLRLAERAELALDDTIARWLPELPFSETVTLRQLLAHTAGVFNYSELAAYHEGVAARPGIPWSFDAFVERAARRPLDFEPGRGFRYSNTGYTLLKRILEQATQLSFGEVVARELAEPLGLRKTATLEQLADMAGVVPGYSRLFSPGAPSEGALQDVRPRYHPGWCGTGLLGSTGPELCRFFDSLFAGRAIAQTSLARMLELTRVPGQHPPAVEPSYGLGVMGDPSGAFGPEYGHGGGGPGWNLRATHLPRLHGHRVSLCVLCNHDDEDAWPVGHSLLASAARALA